MLHCWRHPIPCQRLCCSSPNAQKLAVSAGEEDDMVIAAFKEQQRQYQTVLEGMKVQQSQ